MFLLELVHGAVTQLKRYTPLTISTTHLSEAAQVVINVSSDGIRADWLYRAMEKIHREKEFQLQIQNVASLERRLRRWRFSFKRLKIN